MALLWPVTAGLAIYAVLRWVLREPGGGVSPASASRHALWVGVLGWMASSLHGAGNAGIIPVSTGAAALQDAADILPALAWPILGCLSIHAIGQLSYYAPRRPRRHGTLPRHAILRTPAAPPERRVKDFLPAALMGHPGCFRGVRRHHRVRGNPAALRSAALHLEARCRGRLHQRGRRRAHCRH
ncbi:hypothetical protein [Arthrobacter sp. ZGTC131]|uniref:hypothetical protein n=1 Tax=Arthrobacter sp. ZGTC131 TaxID=2058898 RepID=UPI002157DE1D|nr:hypothetical protein [Arthrobacter sp. ZGTC131]